MASGLLGFIENVFGKKNRDVQRLQPLVDRIKDVRTAYADLDDEQLRAKREEFRRRHAEGESLDDLLPEAYGVVWEGCRRLAERKTTWLVWGTEQAWDMVPYDVQLMGGIVLHQGKIAEMATGEGKTLVAIMPLYLNSLPGKGAHLVTVNDYLARRDAEWMGGVLRLPGLQRRLHPGRDDARGTARGLRLRRHLRHQQRVRLRLPARQHGRSTPSTWCTATSTSPSSTRSTRC